MNQLKKVPMALAFMLFLGISLNAQIKVNGTVTDETGQPVPGVSIIEKGTTNGASTDFDGNYEITVSSVGVTLIYSFIGFENEERVVSNSEVINVQLLADVESLDEVVVIGYGSVRKSDLTGSVVSVKSEDLLQRPSTNLGQALQGKATGVMVRKASSAPGSGVSIVIRGNNSINSSSQPLYIVDGIPLANINTVPVEDIASIEVLKDASSTAIYGSRGANGVILVTTKKGRLNSAAKISYSTRFTFETIPGDLNLMNGEEYATFYSEWETTRNPGMDPSTVWYNGSAYDRPTPSQAGEGTDWFDDITRDGLAQNHLISVSGGSEKTTYATSISYLKHAGVMITGEYNRINVKSAVSTKITDWLDTGLDLFLSNDKRTNAGDISGNGVINSAVRMSPAIPIYNEDGTYSRNSLPGSTSVENPIAQANDVHDFNRTNRAFGNLYLNFKPIEDLSVKISVGGDISNQKNYYYNPSTTITGGQQGGVARLDIRDNNYIISENIATYKKEIGKHKFDVVGGFTYEEQTFERMRSGASDFFTDAYLFNNLAAGKNYDVPLSNKTKWSLASGLGRINYTFNNKYLVTVSGRYDGSSRFGEENKWGFFPSVAGAWRISEEDFMENVDWISNGKIRASWGEAGNQNIGLYQSLATFGLANYPIGNQIASGVAATSLANPDLRWETTQTTNIGFDLGLFNRVNLSFDYYQKTTSDLLLGIALIETSGFNSATMNTGELENKGWEFSVDARIIDKEVKWNTTIGLFQNRNKITKLTDPTQDWKIGHSTGADRGYLQDGIIRTQADLDAYSDLDGVPISGAQIGDYRRVDVNGDYKITGDDQVINFDAQPDFTFSMNNEVKWKALTFSMFLYGNSGGQIKNKTKSITTEIFNVRANMSRDLLRIENGTVIRNFWTPENPNAEYAKLGSNIYPQNFEDATFLKIQDIVVSYDLPLEKIFSQSSIYFSVQNVHTFTDYSGWDPDISTSNTNTDYGYDELAYPTPRSFTLGLNVTF